MFQNLQLLTIAQLFEAQAKLSPNTEAVIFEGNTLSYQELDQMANKLANYLYFKGVRVGSLVGIFLDRSIHQIISILATLKAGAAYVPLDLAYPSERLQFMLEDSGTPLVITHSHLLKSLPPSQAQGMCLDLEWPTIETIMVDQLPQQATPDNLAYIIYTSGSTGKPKGVAMHHRPLVNLLLWQKRQFKSPTARTLQFTPTSFDVSFQEIFSTFSCGGTLVLIKDSIRRNSEALLKYLSEASIERLFLPFIALQNLAEAATPFPDLPLSLKEVITAGEQLKITHSITALFDRLEGCTLANQYGPSESHVVTQYLLEGSTKSWPHLPPIGRAVSNAEIYLLDPHSRRDDDAIHLVEAGQPGELAIGGVSLAKGYLNRPELTKSRFIQNPFKDTPGAVLYRTGDLVRLSPEGELEYIERLDDQVKIRGVRVEIGEIEAQLSQHTHVKANVVVAKKDAAGITSLAAYIVPDRRTEYLDDYNLEIDIRNFLQQSLPDYMAPTFLEFVEFLPLTPSGKVDRRALPSPAQHRPALPEVFVAPQTSTEIKMARLWSNILAFKKIGINDNFFDLGGDSLKAIQLIHMICESFNIQLSAATLFNEPTIYGLSQKITEGPSKASDINRSIHLKTQIEADTQLNLPNDLKNKGQAFNNKPKKILLTGATGFLGAYLLNELLVQTDACIHCLVRADSPRQGHKKIRANLEKYKLWDNKFGDRIKAVIGELGLPYLGLSIDVFNYLSKEIEAIYHSAAAVNIIRPYTKLKAANVRGTESLLQLASKHRLIPFHFISTLDVLQTRGRFSDQKITEMTSLDLSEAVHFDGYAMSKWVAEKMVWNAQDLGLPVCVYRPSMISGDSQTGICNTKDLISNLIKGFIQLQAIPNVEITFNLVPVDFISQSIIHLSLQQESLNKAFNLANPNPISITTFIEGISRYGYHIQVIEFQEWLQLLHSKIDQIGGTLSTIIVPESSCIPSYLERSSINVRQIQDKNVSDGLKNTSIHCPKFTPEDIFRNLNSLVNSDVLTSPSHNLDMNLIRQQVS